MYIKTLFLSPSPVFQLVLAKTQEKAASSLTEVLWLGKKVPVKSEKVRLSLVKLQLVEGELGRMQADTDKMEAYEGLLMECQDTLHVAQQELATTETVRHH